MPTREELKEKVKLLPPRPGIYMMKDKTGKIIYVGKSKTLRNRVSSYFQPIHSLSPKTARLSERIHDFECIYTSTETEALILENELIKRHMPKYNIKLKDAKAYPYIRLSMENGHPAVTMTRKRTDEADRSKYFGPYTSSAAANDIIKAVGKAFRLPKCNKHIRPGEQVGRPCLYYHTGSCMGMCKGDVSMEMSRELYSQLEKFLKGDFDALILELKEKMTDAAQKMQFENAAIYRDNINSLTLLSEQQRIITDPDKEFDVFGIYEGETVSSLAVLFIRGGKVLDKSVVTFSADEPLDDHMIADLVERFYGNGENAYFPRNILISKSIGSENEQTLEALFSGYSGKRINVHTPERGERRAYTLMAVNNACEAAKQKLMADEKDLTVLAELASLIGLEVVPERIEAYDISNNGTSDMYAGMITVVNGRFLKSDYRAFSIKSLVGETNDYAAMTEALERRFAYLAGSNGTDNGKNGAFSIQPDLILLDGGRGHVNTIKALMQKMCIDIPVFGMVKDEYHKTRTLTDGDRDISIAKNMSIFSFIYNIQEEVHRYTFSRMDASRTGKVKRSSLEDIKGVGAAKAKALLSHFKTYTAVKNANVAELCQVKGITQELANEIYNHFNKSNQPKG